MFDLPRQFSHLSRRQHEQPGNEDALRHFAILVRCRLKGLTRRIRKTVQVQAVIPIGTTDQRQPMRTQPVQRVLERTLQMPIKGILAAGTVVVHHLFSENAPIARFLDVSGHSQHQPQRIIVEPGSNIVVAAFGQRLVLMIRPARLQLCGCQIEKPFARPLRDEMDEPQQILIRVAETHAAPDTAFKIRSRTTHIEGDHGLIGVPNIDHAIRMRIGRVDLQSIQQSIPVDPQRLKRPFDFIRIQIFFQDGKHAAFVDGLGIGRIEFCVPWILVIPENEDDRFLFPRFQSHTDLMGTNRLPAMRDGVRRTTRFHRFGRIPTTIETEEIFTLSIKAG